MKKLVSDGFMVDGYDFIEYYLFHNKRSGIEKNDFIEIDVYKRQAGDQRPGQTTGSADKQQYRHQAGMPFISNEDAWAKRI